MTKAQIKEARDAVAKVLAENCTPQQFDALFPLVPKLVYAVDVAVSRTDQQLQPKGEQG